MSRFVEPFRQPIRAFRSAFPDLTVEIIHLLADGDRVIVHPQARYTDHGEFRGMPATAKRIDIQSVIIFRIAEGRLAERWNVIDRYGMWQPLGMLPSQ